MRLLCFLALVAAAVSAMPAPGHAQAAPPCQLMVDASGSMAGYYDAERENYAPDAASARLRPMLEALRRLCGRTYLFDVGVRELPAGASFGAGASHTDIGRSLADWARGAADGTFLILVTDNVEDPGTGGGSGNARFYDLLRRRDSVFSHVSVLALRAPFQGRLFPPDPGLPGVPYAGPRALTIYVLGKGAEGQDQVYRSTRAVLERVLVQSGRREHGVHPAGDYSAYVLFDVRPFAIETFRVQARNVVLRGSRSGGSRCARTRFDPATRTFFLLDQQMGVPCDVAAVLTVAIPQRWCLNDTSLRAIASVRARDPALREGLTATITPPRADLCSEEQELRTTLRFNAIEYDANIGFFERLRRSFRNTFQAEGELIILGALARDNVNLGSGIGQAWSFDDPAGIASADPAMQRRVFQLDSAVRSVVPDEVLVANELVRYRVDLRGRYKQGPVLVIVVVGLFLLLLLAALIFLMRKPKTLVVESDDGSQTSLRLRLFGSGRAAGGGTLAIKLTNLGVCLFVRSTGRVVRGRVLGGGGGRVEVLPDGAARAPTSPARGPDDFGSEPSSGASAPITFTVRTVSAKQRQREKDYDDGF